MTAWIIRCACGADVEMPAFRISTTCACGKTVTLPVWRPKGSKLRTTPIWARRR